MKTADSSATGSVNSSSYAGALVIYLIAGAVGGGYSIATAAGTKRIRRRLSGATASPGAILYEFFATMLFSS